MRTFLVTLMVAFMLFAMNIATDAGSPFNHQHGEYVKHDHFELGYRELANEMRAMMSVSDEDDEIPLLIMDFLWMYHDEGIPMDGELYKDRHEGVPLVSDPVEFVPPPEPPAQPQQQQRTIVAPPMPTFYTVGGTAFPAGTKFNLLFQVQGNYLFGPTVPYRTSSSGQLYEGVPSSKSGYKHVGPASKSAAWNYLLKKFEGKYGTLKAQSGTTMAEPEPETPDIVLVPEPVEREEERPPQAQQSQLGVGEYHYYYQVSAGNLVYYKSGTQIGWHNDSGIHGENSGYFALTGFTGTDQSRRFSVWYKKGTLEDIIRDARSKGLVVETTSNTLNIYAENKWGETDRVYRSDGTETSVAPPETKVYLYVVEYENNINRPFILSNRDIDVSKYTASGTGASYGTLSRHELLRSDVFTGQAIDSDKVRTKVHSLIGGGMNSVGRLYLTHKEDATKNIELLYLVN